MPQLRQRGAMSIMLAMMLVVLLMFIGTAFDLGQLYNRRTDLQNVADSAALAAAKKLNGTSAGIASAAAAAAAVAAAMTYQYGRSITWDNAAIRFSTAPGTPDADWLDVASASAAGAIANLMYVKVDTGALDAALGLVTLPFISALNLTANGAPLDSFTIHSSAVAGRSVLPVTPLGVCALDPVNPVKQRISGALVEAVEWGFRRGINYNLLDLNPVGPMPLNFLVDPINDPATANFAIADVAPFVCSGTMPMTSLPATVRVQFPFPAALSDQLNSRFDVYAAASSPCDPVGAPPDTNVKEILRTTTPAPSAQTAKRFVSPLPLPLGRRVTVADFDVALGEALPPPTKAEDYGVLWSYKKGAKWPVGSSPDLQTANWSTLYPVSSPPPSPVPFNYPATVTPYNGVGASYFLAPGHTGVAERRVLNLPLLACPDPVGATYSTATVLAVGKFFMSAKASAAGSGRISGEFAGILPPPVPGTSVRLYR